MEKLLLHIAEVGLSVNQHRETLLLRKDFHAADECKRLDDVLHALFMSIKAGFNPNQPRVPAGNPNGGQWVSNSEYISRQHHWGNIDTLAEHYDKKAKSVNASSARDYIKKAQDFRERAIRQKLPAVQDRYGNIRYYDPKTNLFGSYNPDGTTKTYFKPKQKTRYFENQIRKYGPHNGGKIINNLSDYNKPKPRDRGNSRVGGGGAGGYILQEQLRRRSGGRNPVR